VLGQPVLTQAAMESFALSFFVKISFLNVSSSVGVFRRFMIWHLLINS
jgi:hypothetical protein